MTVELNAESIKYIIGFITFIISQVLTVRALKKQVNGLGGVVRGIALDTAYIKGHLGIQMLSTPPKVPEIPKTEVHQ
jgi:hypothetical protein